MRGGLRVPCPPGNALRSGSEFAGALARSACSIFFGGGGRVCRDGVGEVDGMFRWNGGGGWYGREVWEMKRRRMKGENEGKEGKEMLWSVNLLVVILRCRRQKP